ncbi:MAG: glycosyltransferase family 39 protein [Gemmataceae bacterium]
MTPSAGRPRRLAGAGLLLAGAAALFLIRLGDRGVVSEEMRWAEVAREMRATGDYFHPTINGHTYYDKPLGSYWLILAAARLTGSVDETTARLPAAVAGLAGVALAMLLGRRLYDSRVGLAAGAILATSFSYAFYARRATADLETTTGVLAAVALFARRRDGPPGPWVIGLWLIMAATSLTKGLLGFALPVAVFVTYGTWTALARGDRVLRASLYGNQWLFNRWSLIALPLAAGLFALPFLVSIGLTGQSDGLAMLWRENVRRFFAPHNHTGPPYLYVGVIVVIAAPWSAFLPAALIPPRSADDGDRLARAYFWAVFAFFTASASRRSYYLLPVLPAAALLVATMLTRPASGLRPKAIVARTIGWVIFALTLAAAGLVLIPSTCLPAPYDKLPNLPARGLFAAIWLIALGAMAWAARRPVSRLLPTGIVVAFAGSVYAFWLVYPAADGYRTLRPFAAQVRAYTDAAPGLLALFHAGDVVYDLARVAPEYDSAADLADALRAGRVRWVLGRRRYLAGTFLPARPVLEEPVRPWEGDNQTGDKLVLLEADAAIQR